MNSFKNILIQAARKAGAFQLKRFGTLKRRDIEYKKHGEYVTYVDKFSGKLITAQIEKHYPGHNIVSEDSPTRFRGSDYTWYIDPLDGTTNYSIQNPLFGVAIAIEYRAEVIESVIYLPILRQMYYARKGHGAYLNGKKIMVSPQRNIRQSIITISFPHRLRAAQKAMSIFKKIRPYVANIRIFGSGDYAFCSVAAGRVEALIMPGDLNPWDSLAGVLLVKEAGGLVTDFRGNKNEYRKDLIISNKKIHQQILNKLR